MEEFESAINWFEIRGADAGGTVVKDKIKISSEIGYFAIIDDTEGNRIYLHSMS